MAQFEAYNEPTSRPLTVYAFDRSRGKTLGNHMTVSVPYEKLENGLTGRYLEVIDYDATFFEPFFGYDFLPPNAGDNLCRNEWLSCDF
jgi:hypothetical protein